MTFSLAGRCTRTNRFGVAISSSSPAVGARCAFVRSGIGAACSQSLADPRLGPRLLDLLESGVPAKNAVDTVAATEPDIAYRQIAALGPFGVPAGYSGELALGTYAQACGDDVVAVGNLLAHPRVVDEMITAFQAEESAELGDRLLAGLSAGLRAGGEADQPVRSAALLISGDVPWPMTDLRVDWHADPIGELCSIWSVWCEQDVDYAQRALAPASAAREDVTA